MMEETRILSIIGILTSLPACLAWHEIYACPHMDRQTSLELRCNKKKDILANIQVKLRLPSDKCTGQSPRLLTEVNNCYWNQTCRLLYAWRTGKTISCKNTDNYERCHCNHDDAKSLLVGASQCINKRRVFNICDAQEPTAKLRRANIIRSDPLFPWNYGHKIQNRTCTKRIDLDNLKPRQSLIVGVRGNDICQSDVLTLISINNTIYINATVFGEIFTFNKKDEFLDVSFKTGQQPNCGSFIVCYKVISKRKLKMLFSKPIPVHACDIVTDKRAKTVVAVDNTYKTECKESRAGPDIRNATSCCCDDFQCEKINRSLP